MRLLTDSVEADEGYVSTQQQQQQQQIRKPSKQTLQQQQQQRRQQPQAQKMNSTHSSESLSSDESSSMSSSPSPADYVFDIMYHDQQASLSMLDIKDPFYEPFFGSLENPAANYLDTSAVGGMTSSFSLSNIANATTTDVLQQLFPDGHENVEMMDHQPMNDFLLNKQKKLKKTTNMTKKYNKKQKNLKNSSSSSINSILQNNLMMAPPTNSVWIDPSIYPLWPNYICLYLEYSLPYDPSVRPTYPYYVNVD